jgi:hypothetical protein
MIGMKALVLSVTRYNFTNTETGELIEGMKVSYVDCENPVVAQTNYRGIQRMELGSPDQKNFNTFSQVPGIYDLSYDIVPGAKGKAVVRYKSAKFIKDYAFAF